MAIWSENVNCKLLQKVPSTIITVPNELIGTDVIKAIHSRDLGLSNNE